MDNNELIEFLDNEIAKEPSEDIGLCSYWNQFFKFGKLELYKQEGEFKFWLRIDKHSQGGF